MSILFTLLLIFINYNSLIVILLLLLFKEINGKAEHVIDFFGIPLQLIWNFITIFIEVLFL